MGEKSIRYREDDWVKIIDSGSIHNEKTGRIKSCDPEHKRYWITLDNKENTLVCFHAAQIKKHVIIEDMESLVDLSLQLGSAAKEMFMEWSKQLNDLNQKKI